MLRNRYDLFARALRVSNLGPGQMALQLGVSVRTTQRWRLGQGTVDNGHLERLARLVERADPALACELRDEVDELVRAAGHALPPRPDLTALQNEPDVRLANDLLKTSSQTLGISAESVRPALKTLLKRAQGGGLTLEGLIRALERGGPR